MSGPPNLSFRLSTSFSLKPPLEADRGPGDGVLVGRTTAGDEEHQAIFVGKAAERPYPSVWLDTRGCPCRLPYGKAEERKELHSRCSCGGIGE